MTGHRYQLYGLNVESTRAVPLLEECDFAAPDLCVDWAEAGEDSRDWKRRSSSDLDRRRSLRVYTAQSDGGEWTKICYPIALHIGELALVADPGTRNVTIECEPGVSERDWNSYFVGPIMGAILRMRGTLVLHASAVEVDGRAICFVGQKRSGKSTHAAGFLRRGHRVLADDMAALTPGEHFRVESGYSRIRVRPGTAELIAADFETRLTSVYSVRDSFYAPLADAFHRGSLPLAAVYLLGPGESGLIRPLQPFQATVRLGQNTFGNYAMTPQLRTSEFANLCALAADVPIRTIGVEYDIANLDTQCDAVLRDLAALQG